MTEGVLLCKDGIDLPHCPTKGIKNVSGSSEGTEKQWCSMVMRAVLGAVGLAVGLVR